MSGANAIRICSLALYVTGLAVNAALEGKPQGNWPSEMEARQKKVSEVWDSLTNSLKNIKKSLPFKCLKDWVFPIGMEFLLGTVLQKVLFRELPKYFFKATKLCPEEIVDALPARIARVALCSFMVGLIDGEYLSKFLKGTFFWGSGPGYLTEALGFAPAAIELFALLPR